MLQSHAAQFAVALAGVAVAEIEQRAGRVDRQVNDRAGADIGQVHVAAVIVRDQRGNRLDLRRHADGTDERLIGQRDLVAPFDATFDGDFDLLDALWQRRVEQRGVAGGDETAELLDQTGGADRLRAARHDRLDVDRERVALLRSIDVNRAVLRIEERKVQYLAGLVGLVLDRALEGVMGFGRDHRAGIDLQHRRRERAIDVVILPLAFFGDGIGFARPALGDPLAGHDGGFEP